VAQLKSTNQSLSQVLELADRSLYLAKNSGKNNVKSENDLFKMGIKIAN
jgi:PleD family two-component response regulator